MVSQLGINQNSASSSNSQGSDNRGFSNTHSFDSNIPGARRLEMLKKAQKMLQSKGELRSAINQIRAIAAGRHSEGDQSPTYSSNNSVEGDDDDDGESSEDEDEDDEYGSNDEEGEDDEEELEYDRDGQMGIED